MHTTNLVGIAVTLLLVLSGCASERFTGGVYEAVYQKQCMDTVSKPNCDPEHKSYDDYKRERAGTPKKQP